MTEDVQARLKQLIVAAIDEERNEKNIAKMQAELIDKRFDNMEREIQRLYGLIERVITSKRTDA